MKDSGVIEICLMWRNRDGSWSSPELMGDRVQDLFQAISEKPYRLMIKPAMEKRKENSPDGHLIAVPAGKR